ncbi:MAG: hypothetical protein NW703_08660 [Nitrospiraceae bacterium]
MRQRQATHSAYPEGILVSPFEGDLLPRFFQRIEMGLDRTGDLVKRTVFLSGLDALNRLYDPIHRMRVVPYDRQSFTELVGSALGSRVRC